MLLQTVELEALASKALTAALAEDRFKAGIVIDSLSSEYLTPEQAARLLMACLGLQRSCKYSIFLVSPVCQRVMQCSSVICSAGSYMHAA